ncbi:MAG TPA: hypothetical protein VKU77_37005 [Streptosporangiaceae bacterium]|nr:hypothetical protein [Streptosporangiaceae bacterium]
MRVRTRALTGEAEVWDPADPAPFATLAGDQFLGQVHCMAVVRDVDGDVLHASPGWLVIRIDGPERRVAFTSSSAFGGNGTWQTGPAG